MWKSFVDDSISVNLTRKDVIKSIQAYLYRNMIKGVQPSHEQMESLKAFGWYSGSYDKWTWNENFPEISIKELYDLYLKLQT